MTEQLMEVITTSIFAILVSLIGWATNWVVAYFKSKGITETLASKKYLLDIIVYGIKQMYIEEGGEIKKQKAIEYAEKQFKKYGWPVDSKEIEMLLEAAYVAMQAEIKPKEVTVEEDLKQLSMEEAAERQRTSRGVK